MVGGARLRDIEGKEGAGASERICIDWNFLILSSHTKRFQDARDDAVQLEHEVVALLPATSSVFQLLLLVVAVRVEQTGPR